VITPRAYRSSTQNSVLRKRFLVLALMELLLGAANVRAATIPLDGKEKEKPYALIYGTVYGPDSRPVYGVKVKIRRTDQKKPKWELYSDHSGEFAQRVPAGPADYIIWADLKGYKAPNHKDLRLDAEVNVHIQNDERSDISLHLK
jgi:hypothetical protein